MRATELKFTKGDRIRVRVVEVQRDRSLVVEFSGSLFRVRNDSNRIFIPEDLISLEVVSTDPLQFQFPESNIKVDRYV